MTIASIQLIVPFMILSTSVLAICPSNPRAWKLQPPALHIPLSLLLFRTLPNSTPNHCSTSCSTFGAIPRQKVFSKLFKTLIQNFDTFTLKLLVSVRLPFYVQSTDHILANSRSQATALDQMLPGPSEHDFLDRESLPSHALDTPERFSGGTSSLNKFFNQGNLYQPNSTQTTLATPSRSFPVYVCRGCPHGHCARRYSYPGAWKKHFEEQHLLAYWSMSDYLVCPHCTRNFHVNTDAFQKHLWAHMSEG
jgi:hypothetical protein